VARYYSRALPSALNERKIKLLAVDLDGTLVDSAPDIAHCLGSALATQGYARPGEARTRSWIGDGLETLISRALAHAAGGDVVSRKAQPSSVYEARHNAVLAAFLACYRDNLFVRSRLYANAVTTLDSLRDRGVRLCCITNKRYTFAERLLAEAGVADRFELLLGGDSLAEKKPSPLPLNVAAKTLSVEPNAATLLGDSQQDLRAARSAGYAFVLAGYGYGKVDDAELGVSPRIRRFDEICAALGV